MIKEILKDILRGIIIGIGILFTLFLFFFCWSYISWGEVKTFFKAYPWGTTDTTTVANQRELAWERSKGFSFVLEGMADIGGIRLLYDRPRIIMYRQAGDTAWFNAQAIARPGKIDSMYAWIIRNGYSIDSCYLHWDSTRVWASAFLEAYDDTNDLDDNSVRDFDSYEGLAERYGVNYIVDTQATWTNNEWVGQAVYTLTGILLDTITGNSAESLWYDVADTTNLINDWSFETCDSIIPSSSDTSWYNYGGRQVMWAVGSVFSCSTRSCVIIPDDSSDWIYLFQKIIDLTDNEYVRFRARVKANSTRFRILLRPGNNLNVAGLLDYYIPADSVDTSWHYYGWTLLNHYSNLSYNEESLYITVGYQQPQINDTAYIDCIEFLELKGLLPSWKSTGNFGENVTYRPFIIDSLGIYNHTATCQTESLARCNYNIQYGHEYFANIGYSGYQYFQKWWSAKVFDVRSAFGFDGIFMDEMWSYTPIVGRNWTAEYGSDQAQYKADAITLNGMVQDTLSGLGKYTFINAHPDTIWGNNVDGILSEGQDNPQYSTIASNWDTLYGSATNYPLTGYQNNLWRYGSLRDKNKIVLYYSGWNSFEQTVNAEAITRYDTVGNHQYENWHKAEFEEGFAGRNRARVTSLAEYLLRASDSTYYWYEINYGYLPREFYWSGILDLDLGEPVDTAYEFASGVDDSGIAYVIAGRKYYSTTLGDTILVLVKPKSYMTDWWHCYTSPPCSLTAKGGYYNTSDTTTWDKFPATTHNLNGHWLRFRFDGTFESEDYKTIDLKFNEGAILLRQSCD